MINTAKLNISKAQWIQISCENLGHVKVKQSQNELVDWETTNVFKRGITVDEIIPLKLQPIQAYNRISNEKKSNMKMLPYSDSDKQRQFSVDILEESAS